MVTVLYFAVARQAVGMSRESLHPAGDTVRALRQQLSEHHPPLRAVLPRCRLAVNQEFADDDGPVPDGAEVAVIPPVSGGASLFRVVDHPLSLSEVVEAVAGSDMGGVVAFRGDVRAVTRGRQVLRLEYEAYRPMAERKLQEIGQSVERTHGARVAILHRVGLLLPGEAAVVIACAAPHRSEAFRACETTIEQLKKEVPIWKKEVFEDGSTWVGMGP